MIGCPVEATSPVIPWFSSSSDIDRRTGALSCGLAAVGNTRSSFSTIPTEVISYPSHPLRSSPMLASISSISSIEEMRLPTSPIILNWSARLCSCW